MSLWRLNESTESGSIPSVIRPFTAIRKVFPSTLATSISTLRKTKRRLLKRMSKMSPPMPPRVI
jgi:hypothetical protein